MCYGRESEFPPTEAVVCVPNVNLHVPRIGVGAISESRQIGGNWSVGNRSSLLQKRLCVSNVIYTFTNWGRSDLRIATHRRELECRESEGISIALLIQSLDPSYRGCVTVGNRNSLLQKRLCVSNVNLHVPEFR